MMMKMKNEDDNHMYISAENSTCSSLFLLLHPCFGFSFIGASNFSFSPLSKLKSLQIGTYDKEIEGGVSEEIGKLTSLKSLSIAGSPNLESLPEAIGELSSLQTLEIIKCFKLTSLLEGIDKLSSLQSLTIDSCNNLASLPQGIGNLESLHSFRISFCNNFTSFPESIGNLKSLEKFEINYWPSLASLPEGIGNLASLRELNVQNCENLTSLPQGLRCLTSLNTLVLYNCSTLLWKRCKKETGEDWPKIAHIPNLHISPPIENDSEPEDNLGGGGKILSAFKTLMHCN